MKVFALDKKNQQFFAKGALYPADSYAVRGFTRQFDNIFFLYIYIGKMLFFLLYIYTYQHLFV